MINRQDAKKNDILANLAFLASWRFNSCLHALLLCHELPDRA
jgi:hypothetical protein